VPYLGNNKKDFETKTTKTKSGTTSAILPAELHSFVPYETKESGLPSRQSVPNCASGRRSSPGAALDIFLFSDSLSSQIRSDPLIQSRSMQMQINQLHHSYITSNNGRRFLTRASSVLTLLPIPSFHNLPDHRRDVLFPTRCRQLQHGPPPYTTTTRVSSL